MNSLGTSIGVSKLEGYVSLKDAAAFLGLKPSYLYEFARPGSAKPIPSRRVGKYRLFKLSELVEWVERNAQ